MTRHQQSGGEPLRTVEEKGPEDRRRERTHRHTVLNNDDCVFRRSYQQLEDSWGTPSPSGTVRVHDRPQSEMAIPALSDWVAQCNALNA